ncbi:acyltransferase family protein [Rhabdothermincola sediminis]|uniref:acyltransferase family protein n=1 Tax=Rhabdothermincola sediminis TaxID=2751370 RepID=UPI001AA09664|nr:acyltransferase family protein [Rhabdothermincola sediminis]
MTAPTTASRAAVPPLSTRLPYMPGLDGLRALAVISVLVYHAGYGWASGGFLGVEVFFVISGYLITALLLAEWRDSGSITLREFWLRRARRLLPALFLLLILVSAVAVIFLPGEVASLRGDVLSAIAYVTNWNFIIGQKSYFEFVGRPSLVTHLWSLAVEEQFYLVWPLVFIGGMKLLGRRLFPAAVLAAALGSVALMWVLFDPNAGDPSRVYYGTDTRAAGLLLGCALAFVWSPWRLRRDVARGAAVVLDTVGATALLVLVYLLTSTGEFDPALYRGGFLRLDIVTLMVIAVAVHPAAHLGRVLGIAPMRWVGLRSYGIYLFHWPVYQLTRPGIDVSFDGVPLFALRLAITLALAELSYRFVELPIRRGAFGRRWRELRSAVGERRQQLRLRWVTAGTAGFALLGLLAVTIGLAKPPPPPDYLAVGSTGPIVELPQLTTTTDLPATTTTTTTPVVDPASVPVVTEPPTTVAPPPPPATIAPTATVTAMGDSVMLGAASTLQALGPGVQVDAAVGRQVQVGLEMLAWYRDAGLLGQTVVVHLGNNGTFTAAQFDRLVELLAGHRIIVLTVKVPRGWEAPNNQVIFEGVQRHPSVEMIDWKSIGEAHPEFFYDDGMHLRPEGARFYADTIAYVLNG